MMMDDDVLQTLFTHWIGIHWAVCIKRVLKDITQRGLWNHGTHFSDDDSALLRYYLGNGHVPMNGAVADHRKEEYMENFFLHPLPSGIFEESSGYDDDDDVEREPRWP